MGKLGYRKYVTCLRPIGARAEMLPSTLALKPYINVSGNSNRGFVSTLWGGMGREMGGRLRREGTYLYIRLIHVDV